MDITLFTAHTLGSKSKSDHTSVYSRKYERNYHNYTGSKRSHKPKSIWRRIKQLVRNQRNAFRRYSGLSDDILLDGSRGRFSTRNSKQTRKRNNWFSSIGNDRHRQRYNYKRYYGIALCLLTIGSPALAEGDEVNNTAAPSSTATGNVTNQAVQFQNNGAPSRQNMGSGIACNGPTMTFSPFWLASENKPYDPESYSQGWNYGGQLNFMFPLDGEITERCKSIAKRKEEKMRVDYELVRAIKCAELMQKGFTLRPQSRVEHLCNDVIPIRSLLKPKNTTEQ